MSNFAFLKIEWPDMHDAACKAEALAYHENRRYCSEAHELAALPDIGGSARWVVS